MCRRSLKGHYWLDRSKDKLVELPRKKIDFTAKQQKVVLWTNLSNMQFIMHLTCKCCTNGMTRPSMFASEAF